MKDFIKILLPTYFLLWIKKNLRRPTLEYLWIQKTKKQLYQRIKKEIIITEKGEFFLRSSFGFDYKLDISNPNLKLDTFDDNDFKYLLSFLCRKLPDKAVIFDIGAYCGGYSLAMSQYFPAAKIYAFEPIKSSYSNLIDNISRNKKTEIFPYRYAVSDKDGYVTMTTGLSTGNHILVKDKKYYSNNDTIQAITVDSFVINNKIQRVDFIKCDVEGHELSVIKGALNTIKNSYPVIYMEIKKEWTSRFGYNPIDLVNEMSSLEYITYVISNSSISEVLYFEKAFSENENFIFINKKTGFNA